MDTAETATKPQKVTAMGIRGMLTDAAIAGAIFVLFVTYVIPEHVPVYDPFWRTLFAGYTSTVMGGFFFMLLVLFRITLVDQLRDKALNEGLIKTVAKALAYVK